MNSAFRMGFGRGAKWALLCTLASWVALTGYIVAVWSRTLESPVSGFIVGLGGLVTYLAGISGVLLALIGVVRSCIQTWREHA